MYFIIIKHLNLINNMVFMFGSLDVGIVLVCGAVYTQFITFFVRIYTLKRERFMPYLIEIIQLIKNFKFPKHIKILFI